MTTGGEERPGTPTLCLIDGSALAYRSYYAFIRRPLMNSRGENVSAAYGFASSLLKLLDDLRPSFAVVAFDTPEPTFRHETYAEYKATRRATPAEMIAQLPSIREIVTAFGIPIVEAPGYEADDVIGTLAIRAKSEGVHSVVVSGDKDFLQLVGPGIAVLDPGKGILYSPAEVERQFGAPPERVVEVLALAGDASDNVPGVPGIGRKTATELIAKYGTVESVLEHLAEIPGEKRRANLSAHSKQALESRKLVTIHVTVPIELPLEALKRKPLDAETLGRLFRELEFPSLIQRIPVEERARSATVELVTSPDALEALVGALEASGGFALDLETKSPDPLAAEIAGVALAHEEGRAFYIAFGHEEARGLARDDALARLRPLLENPGVPKYGQDLKSDYEVLRANGIELRGMAFDTTIASYLLDPGRRQHGLAALALEHLGRRMTPIETLIGKGKAQLSFDRVDLGAASEYASEGAEVTYRLTGVLGRLVREAGLSDLMRELEMPLVTVLAKMELRGVAVDVAFLEVLGARFGEEIEKLRARVHDLAGVAFNIDSPRQVGEVLFERLKLARGRRIKTGYSTDIEVLERLSEVHEVPRLILSYRQLMKLKAGYVDQLPKLVHPATGRVHTSFNQTITSTGRLSSSNPNLQSIPVRTELGREIRKAFVAGPGKALVSADYSQIELRIMAHLSRDENLIEAFHAGKDVHRSTAALIFGKGEERITPSERDWAKTVNFGIMYGMSPFGLAKELGISHEEAAAFIAQYFAAYPRVREFTEEAVRRATETGYTATMMGRRRAIRELQSTNAGARGLAERTAVNTPIQGSAADLVKSAMLGVDARIAREKVPCDMVLQVHDELVFEVDEGAVADAAAVIREEMERPKGFDLAVPIVVNLTHGRNWHEAH